MEITVALKWTQNQGRLVERRLLRTLLRLRPEVSRRGAVQGNDLTVPQPGALSFLIYFSPSITDYRGYVTQ